MRGSNESVTGRDAMIMGKALLYAIGHIQKLPKHERETSDMGDMCALVHASMSGVPLAYAVLSVEGHTGAVIDLWPIKDQMTDADRAAETVLRSAIDKAKEEFRVASNSCPELPRSGVGATSQMMGRKQFNSFVTKLFDADRGADVVADEMINDGIYFVELFRTSPQGPLVAVHHWDTVRVIRLVGNDKLGDRPAPRSGLVAKAEDDEKGIAEHSRKSGDAS